MKLQKYTAYFALLLFSVAVLLRIALAVRPGLWADEIFSLALATGHSLEHPATDAKPAMGDYLEPPLAQLPSAFHRYMQHESPPAGVRRVIRAVLISDTNPPLYYLVLNLWTRIVGTTDAALRLFSTLWALACFPLLWILGRKMNGRATAWTACILFTFSPPALYYSSEGRMYSLVWFLALVLVWSSFALADYGSRPHVVLLWTLSGAAGLLTHYFFAFVLLACFLWLWIHPGKVPRIHLAGVAILAVFIVLPWYLQLPESIGRWRVTGDWLATPLTWKQALTSPFILAWSLLSGRGAWGGYFWVDCLAAGFFALLALVVLRQGLWSILSGRGQLPLLWLLAICLGSVLFDLGMHTNASTIRRYALPALPAAILLATLGIRRLPKWANFVFLFLIVLAWLTAYQFMCTKPPRWTEPYRDVGARIIGWAGSSDMIIVHSIPSGVLGVARYMDTSTPIASWVVQLGQRHVPDDLEALLADFHRVVLVKIHHLGEPSPPEAWLRKHAILERHDRWDMTPEDRKWNKTEILFFALSRHGDVLPPKP